MVQFSYDVNIVAMLKNVMREMLIKTARNPRPHCFLNVEDVYFFKLKQTKAE